MDAIYQKVLTRYLKGSTSTKWRILKEFGFSNEAKFFDHILYVPKVTEEREEEEGLLDYVIAFDTTGSMGSYIEAVKNHVRELIPQLFDENPNIQIGVVAFGDYQDKTSIQTFGDAYQTIPLTNSQYDLINFIDNAKNTYGGDSDEFYELVINKVNNETAWRDGATRTVLLIGDADPHAVGYSHVKLKGRNKIDWKVEAEEAVHLGIQYDTLTINGKSWYKVLSKMTNGISIPFNNSSRTQEAVYASVTSRGGTDATRHAFTTTMASAVAAGDTELEGVYKSLSSKLKE